MDAEQTQPPVATGRKKRKFWKWVLGLFLFFVLAFIALILAMPAIYSTDSGRTALLQQINGAIHGSVSIGQLQLSWFGKQSIGDFSVKDPHGVTIASFENLTSDTSLWRLFGSGCDLGKSTLRGLRADLRTNPDGSTNLGQALSFKQPLNLPASQGSDSATALPENLRFDCNIEDATIHYSAPGAQSAELRLSNAHVKMPDTQGPITFSCDGATEQGGLSGSINATGEIRDLFTKAGKMTADKVKVDVQASAKNLPVLGLDALLSQRGLLTAALGPQLNLQVQGQTIGAEGTATIAIQSPNLKAQTLLEKKGGDVHLVRPASVQLTVTPQFARFLSDRVSRQRPVVVDQPVPLTLTVASLSIPLDAAKLGKFSLKSSLKSGDWHFSGDPAVQGVSMDGLEVSLDSEALAQSLDCTLKGSLMRAGQNNPFNAQISLTDLLDSHGNFQPAKIKAAVQGQAHDVPVELLDRIIGQEDLLASLLGPSLSVSVQPDAANAADALAVGIDATQLKTTLALSFDQGVALASPMDADWTLTPAAFTLMAGAGQPIALQQDLPAHIHVDRFSLPRKVGNSGFDFKQMALEGAVRARRDFTFSNLPQASAAAFHNASAEISGESLTSLRLDLHGTATFPANAEGWLPAIFAQNTSVDATINGLFSGEGTIPFNANLDGPAFSGKLQGEVLPNAIELSKPTTIQAQLTPQLFQQMARLSGGDVLRLAAPAPISLNLQALSIPRGAMAFDNLAVELSASVPRLVLAGNPHFAGATLSDADIEADIDGDKDEASFKIKGDAQTPGDGQPGQLNASLTLSDLMSNHTLSLGQASIQASIDADHFSTALVEALTGATGKITPWTGPSLQANLDLDLRSAQQKQGMAEIRLKGDNLSVDAGLRIEDAISLTRAANVQTTLTPEMYRQWILDKLPADQQSIDLAEAAPINATIDSLNIPRLQGGDGRFDWTRAAFQARVSSPKAVLVNRRSQQNITLDQAQVTLITKQLLEALQLNLASNFTGDDERQPGRLVVNGRLSHLLDSVGNFDPARMGASANLSITAMPVAQLEGLLGAENRLEPILGAQTDLTVAMNLQNNEGPVSIRFKGGNASGNFDANVSNDAVALAKTARMQVGVTPELARAFLKKINPLLISAVSADAPMTIAISPDGASFPRRGFNIADARIDNAVLSLGKVNLKNSDTLAGVLDLAKAQLGEQVPAQFTPLVAHLQNGLATYERMDVDLPEALHLATWGQVDLRKDWVDMRLALTPDSTSRFFNMDLPQDAALQIPLTGPSSSIRVDWGALAQGVAQLESQGKLQNPPQGSNSSLGNALQIQKAPALPVVPRELLPAPGTQPEAGANASQAATTPEAELPPTTLPSATAP